MDEEKIAANRLLEKYNKELEDEYERNKNLYIQMYDDLPEIFKKRIDQFRINNDNFRVRYEKYELYCCQQAMIIVNKLKTLKKVTSFIESSRKFELVPELDHGHSANSLHMASSLAYWYLKNPNDILTVPGCLSVVVGKREYEEKNKRRKLS